QSYGRISRRKICVQRLTISRNGNAVTAGCDSLQGLASARPVREESRASAEAGATQRDCRRLQQLFGDGIGQQFSGASQSDAICLAREQSVADQFLCLISIDRVDDNSLTRPQTERDVLDPFHCGS